MMKIDRHPHSRADTNIIDDGRGDWRNAYTDDMNET
jgi:hypothetical protein